MTRASRYIAFLRAINVGGHVVSMAELRRHFEALGLDEVETFIASGNVIFSSAAADAPALERKIERRLADALGYEVKTFIRTNADVAAIAAYAPYTEERIKTAHALHVGFLAEPLGRAGTKTLMAFASDVEAFHTRGREVYWLTGVPQSESRFNNAVFERALGVRATWRNRNTVMRLAAKYGG